MIEFITTIPWWGWALAYGYVQIAAGMAMTVYGQKKHIPLDIILGLAWPVYLPATIIGSYLTGMSQ